MNRYIYSTFFSLLLLLGSVMTSAYAQTDMGPDVGNVGTGVSDQQNRTNDGENTFEPGVGGGPGGLTTTPGADNGLYWLWLLPLLAIPLLYFVWRSSDDTSESRGYRE